MSCNPHGTQCATHCISNACNANRPSCSSNRVVTLSNVHPGDVISHSDLETLRVNAINEISRWNENHSYNFPITATTPINAGSIIKASDFDSLIYDLSSTGHGSTNQVSPGSIIDAGTLANSMLSLYNNLRTNCICNSDCGSHQVCSCHGNCNCHYNS